MEILIVIAAVAGFAFGWLWRARTEPAAYLEKIANLETELSESREAETVVRTKLENAQLRFEEEKARLNEICEQMENTFKVMAANIAKSNSEEFLKQANEQFKVLKEVSEKELESKKKLIDENLSNMKETLNRLHKQSTELKTSMDTHSENTKNLNENTAKLSEILSSSRQRGQWGERMVKDILQSVGLVERINYTHQESVESGQRPDYTFLLPRDKRLNMDVKFPLDHYRSYLSAESDEARVQEQKSFLRDVRNHVNTVCGREYINPAEGTLDYVMLFIPNESVYGFINENAPELVDHALRSRVLLCSPLTLYAVLSLIHQAARSFVLNERASEVMALVEKFREQWGKYVEQMDKLGRRIEGLSGDFQTLVTTRTRALEKPLDKIEAMAIEAPDSENS